VHNLDKELREHKVSQKERGREREERGQCI